LVPDNPFPVVFVGFPDPRKVVLFPAEVGRVGDRLRQRHPDRFRQKGSLKQVKQRPEDLMHDP
jgi:hypothetical protein